jgi:hypothetical protein
LSTISAKIDFHTQLGVVTYLCQIGTTISTGSIYLHQIDATIFSVIQQCLVWPSFTGFEMIKNTGQIRKAMLCKLVGATKERLSEEAIFIAGIKSSTWGTW